MTVVGHVAALWRYPVKSMAGEKLDAVEVSWHGLAGDRRWAFIRAGQVRTGYAFSSDGSGRIHTGSNPTARSDSYRRVLQWLAR